MSPPDEPEPEAPPSDRTRYVLLTQCLQNDFFLNRECSIYLGDQTSMSMLVGRTSPSSPPAGDGQLDLSTDEMRNGPLGTFLRAVIDRRRSSDDGCGTLHVINIRDWHEPGPTYDLERRTYGNHCEQGTWGAGYVDGLRDWLDPLGQPLSAEAGPFAQGSVSICHVHSDSVFDFRPRLGVDNTKERKLPQTDLETILDILVQADDRDVAELDRLLADGVNLGDEKVKDVARRAAATQGVAAPVYMAVIGAYSDVKILTLLGGLLSRYELPNLALSDTLSGSPTLERHISGLDFAHKVMNIEVIHGVNDLVRYLGGTPPLKSEDVLVGSDGFARYQTFFKDKQSVLSYESEKLRDYLSLTQQRSLETYNWIRRSNQFLIIWGSLFLVVTLVLVILSAVGDGVPWTLPAITGGVGLLQLVTAFFTRPSQHMQQNLMNLTSYRMILESHSLKMALARFHLTTPHTLREIRTAAEAKQAAIQITVLERELAAISQSDAADHEALRSLGFAGPGRGNGSSVSDPHHQEVAT